MGILPNILTETTPYQGSKISAGADKLTDSRDLNYLALDTMVKAGFEYKYIVESLIKAMDANQVNDLFAFIYRVHDFTEDNEEFERVEELLAKYEVEN